jgi:hypothetical protein
MDIVVTKEITDIKDTTRDIRDTRDTAKATTITTTTAEAILTGADAILVTTILTDVGVMAVSLSQSMLRVWTTAPIAVGSPLRKHAPCVADLAESTRTN